MTRVFFVDRDLGRRILPDALERAGLAVERLDELQPPAVVRVYRPTPRELVFEGKPGRVQPKTLGEPERFG